MRKFVILLLSIFIFSFLSQTLPAFARQESFLISSTVDYEFGKIIQFEAELSSTQKVDQIQLVIRSDQSAIENIFSLEISPDNLLTFIYDPEIHGNIRAFSFVDYYYIATFEDGSTSQSPLQNFLYADNRFEWKRSTLNENFTVYWFTDNESFANKALAIADKSIDHLNQFISFPQLEESISIISYSNPADLQSALMLSGQTWVAGHADPQSSLVFLSIEQNQQLEEEMGRQLPHEIAHINLYRSTGSSSSSLPIWFNEGIASLAEMTPNPNYQNLLLSAYDNDQLISMSNLCEIFPANSSSIALAYAQSDSFLRYLHREYGKAGLNRLLQAYKEGDSCAFGTVTAFSISLENLEEQWRKSIFQDVKNETNSSEVLPFLYIFGFISVSIFAIILSTLFKYRNSKRE